ncbi:hypothetical protein OSB04_014673 [Centaurea solstitialis]|uniref:Uncharacterized protein n=1 Tax=Centaurea solstitialis TaxID=347529 RepID=A0AA38THE4_9ASTR|nr:hypothetical protein OSB04_014673 [Centaurea solstitialis]
MPCIISCRYRSKLRSRFALVEDPCTDCMTHCCCEYCALCQEYRELNHRGINPSAGNSLGLIDPLASPGIAPKGKTLKCSIKRRCNKKVTSEHPQRWVYEPTNQHMDRYNNLGTIGRDRFPSTWKRRVSAIKTSAKIV